MDLPTRSFERLWHVGTFEPDDKGCNGSSYEGSGLSVSTHPDAWTRIARLGGAAVWELDTAGLRLLDAHRLTGSQRDEIRTWALDSGWAAEVLAWQVPAGDEYGDGYFTFLDQVDADAEADDRDVPVTEIVALVPTPSLCARSAATSGHPADTWDWLLAAFAEDHGLDGVWWDERLDPLALSAPRGVLNACLARDVARRRVDCDS